ncbi:dicer-like protein 2 [Delitschia confertaspora ATCC 74209]|uniref:Dicer-like protein 2 n=1 Tax=Delitschia confertaspora ATCC 74209 TaxID=1513339 RepID=A0A9P4JSU6_9PLEO|nr:dicer-like protein 2 [Delitschia confertaspora ATCC 74209]
MDLNQEPLDDGNSVIAGLPSEPFRLRSYQAEMVDESLKRNVIVTMDTGSGKTHIAIARTAAALETCRPDQLVWFLAPTVTLCEQQYEVFKSHLPAFGVRALSGKDNVDYWTDQAIWDAALKNIRVVLSTHQVLLDALTHAFVKLSRIALIIFDEAHHCTLKHPANRIMTHFYKPLALKGGRDLLPQILGLSASPVMRAKADGVDLKEIEHNLNATAKTPKIHRSELLRFVHKPELVKIAYPFIPSARSTHSPNFALLSALKQAYAEYDIMTDPYVCSLVQGRARGDQGSTDQLIKVFASRETWCRKHIKALIDKTQAMLDELGASPAEWYLRQCIGQYARLVQGSYHQQLVDLPTREKQHLYNILGRCHAFKEWECLPMSLDHLSGKVQTLIDVLISESGPNFTGLVFVEQRIWVTALAEILATDPRTKSTFKIGTFVGTSTSTKRKTNLADLAELRNQRETLDDFRSGKKNLILTTSVLEEGIDVSSCHLVVCFEPPKNLKSFIQRRGRARKEKSKYIILIPESGSILHSPEKWHLLEEDMKKAYVDDLREAKAAEEQEKIDEYGHRVYQVPSTGALLTLDNATQHLYHFCAILRSGPYVDSRPQFSFTEDSYGGIIAHVTLPISVVPNLRKATSLEAWGTERMARNDAAFQAYKALHLAGLLNDNLLPLVDEGKDEQGEFNIQDRTPSLIEVLPSFDPWVAVAEVQASAPQLYYQSLLTVATDGENSLRMVLLTPSEMPDMPPTTLFWNETKTYTVNASPLATVTLDDEELTVMRSITLKLLCSVFGSRMPEDREDFLYLFVPCDGKGFWNLETLKSWRQKVEGIKPALDIVQRCTNPSSCGWVQTHGDMRKYILKNIIHPSTSAFSSENAGTRLEVMRAPKRRDFLHRVPAGNSGNEAYTTVHQLDAAECVVDCLPSSYTIFALFVPSIIHRYGNFLLAERLRTSILRPVTFNRSHLSLILTAMTSSATNEEDNYQRMEFLGDCVLKYITSIHLMASRLAWPESLLTARKGHTNSNGFLARATMAAGLERFIITKRFTGLKWKPTYVGDLIPTEQPTESIFQSSKLLADVVESLIGASYIQGGITKALTCIQTLLPLESWMSISNANQILYNAAPSEEVTHISAVEKLIGYTFTKKMLLLEALTHASYNGPTSNCSYERLEFLGDAVLDFIIVKRLFAHSPPLSHQTMHSIRTAMANASFLAFRMFETILPEEKINIYIDETMHARSGDLEIMQRALWQFLRHSSPHITENQFAAKARHEKSREEILEEMRNGKEYPWQLFAFTDAEKFHSDIVESVLGAVYIDSHGSISACEAFVAKLGISDCLERILRDGVDCLHPKERLGIIAVEKKVEYVNLGRNKGGMWQCRVRVGDKEVGGVVEGMKRLGAETVAAWKAVGILRGVECEETEVVMEKRKSNVRRWQRSVENGNVHVGKEKVEMEHGGVDVDVDLKDGDDILNQKDMMDDD